MLFTPAGTQTAAAKSALGIFGGTTVRPRAKRFRAWNLGTVATDSNIEILWQRVTTTGTSTSVTPGDPDNGDPAAVGMTFGSNFSAEPTVTSNSKFRTHGYNPRGNSEWFAVQESQDVLLPATASNGIAALLNTLGGGVNIWVEADVQN